MLTERGRSGAQSGRGRGQRADQEQRATSVGAETSDRRNEGAARRFGAQQCGPSAGDPVGPSRRRRRRLQDQKRRPHSPRRRLACHRHGQTGRSGHPSHSRGIPQIILFFLIIRIMLSLTIIEL